MPHLRRAPAVYCLAALSALIATLAVLRGCRPDPAGHLERLVWDALPLGEIEDVRFGPHRLGERSSVIRVRYRHQGKERDELYLVRDGAVLLGRTNHDGDDWQDQAPSEPTSNQN